MPDPLPFSPAEALILLDPARWHGREGIKATLLALLARGALRLETQPGRGLFHRRTTALRVTLMPLPQLAPQENALVGLVRDADRRGGTMTAVVRQARSQFGADLNRFDRDLVRPGLMRRGLLMEGYKPFLLLFRRRNDALTPAGVSAQRAVDAAMQRVREIPSVIEHDPAAAAAIALGAGAAIFLVPEVRSYYAQLSAAMRPTASGDGGGGDSNNDSGGEDDRQRDGSDLSGLNDALGGATDATNFDLGGLDLSGFDFSAFDSFDSAMDSFDSSFDSAADSGGGDGGGGDGGGGSGC